MRDGLLQADCASDPGLRRQLCWALCGDASDPPAHTEGAVASAVTIQVTSYNIWQAAPGQRGTTEVGGTTPSAMVQLTSD